MRIGFRTRLNFKLLSRICICRFLLLMSGAMCRWPQKGLSQLCVVTPLMQFMHPLPWRKLKLRSLQWNLTKLQVQMDFMQDFIRCWATVGVSVYDLAINFFQTRVLPQGINEILIVFILKVTNPTLVSQFHPISFVNEIFKIVIRL